MGLSANDFLLYIQGNYMLAIAVILITAVHHTQKTHPDYRFHWHEMSIIDTKYTQIKQHITENVPTAKPANLPAIQFSNFGAILFCIFVLDISSKYYWQSIFVPFNIEISFMMQNLLNAEAI